MPKKPLKIKRGNYGTVFELDDGTYGIDWLRKNENNFRQHIVGLSKSELRAISNKITEFLEN